MFENQRFILKRDGFGHSVFAWSCKFADYNIFMIASVRNPVFPLELLESDSATSVLKNCFEINFNMNDTAWARGKES
jgi:hypothetical protein